MGRAGIVRNEIGSEFWDIPLSKKKTTILPEDSLGFLSGRTALKHILRTIGTTRKLQTAAIPSWCCSTVILPFLEEGISVRFYDVLADPGAFRQDLDVAVDCDVILVMDFFGFSGFSMVPKDLGGVVIRDMTHSAFSDTPQDADYYFGSLRKWAAFATGGFAWAKDGWGAASACLPADDAYVRLRREAFSEKKRYMTGDSDSKDYLEVFSTAGERLEKSDICAADPADEAAVRFLDADFIRQRRRENASLLMCALAPYLIFKTMRQEDCPLFVPILVPDGKRDALRKHLIAKDIYCPVHWPVSEWHQLNDRTENVYRNGLSLVCDQRYLPEDMEKIIQTVREFGL